MHSDSPLTLDRIFLFATWFETCFYGLFCALGIGSMYITFRLRKSHNIHSMTMATVGVTMFAVGTIHLGLTCARMIHAYSGIDFTPSNSIIQINHWQNIFLNILFTSQCLLGEAVAVYRCYILWDGNWRYWTGPAVLLVASTVCGYTMNGIAANLGLNSDIFNPSLNKWLTAFYSLLVVENMITSVIMGIRIWKTDRRVRQYRQQNKGKSLIPILHILMESAALQLVFQLFLVISYAANSGAYYIVQQILPAVIGITFTAITIRIALNIEGSLKIIGGFDLGLFDPQIDQEPADVNIRRRVFRPKFTGPTSSNPGVDDSTNRTSIPLSDLDGIKTTVAVEVQVERAIWMA